MSQSALTGPGSQPAEDGFEYMEMPKGMRTFALPDLPEPEDAASLHPALAKLEEVLAALRSGGSVRIGLDGLDAANRAFVDQTLGDGEVSIIAGNSIQVQESVFAGVWRLHEVDAAGALIADAIETGPFPPGVLHVALEHAKPGLVSFDGTEPAGLMNAPALITEIVHKLAGWQPGAEAGVINFSLLPLSDDDAAYLDARLGQGAVTILSRGYGNCRITSTAAHNAWRVRYYNSREIVILDTLEITGIPAAACAAVQDLEDSAARLAEILEIYR
jgi:hydrogenase-1 operon protein HyaF